MIFRITILILMLPMVGYADSNFKRGDANGSGVVDITDAIFSLDAQFLGNVSYSCDDAADTDDSGVIDLTDPINTLSYLFLGTFIIPSPGPDSCGIDPTDDELLCEEYLECPQVDVPLTVAPQVDQPESPTKLETIDLSGQVEPGFDVEILGGEELVIVDTEDLLEDGSFTTRVPLQLNRRNRIFVTGIKDGIKTEPRAITVIQDSEAPVFHIDHPGGTETREETVTVVGRISDVLSGFMGLEVFVRHNREANLPEEEVEAEVIIGIGTNGTFERRDIQLDLGENTLEVVARDKAGNDSEKHIITITRLDPLEDAFQLIRHSGNNQDGVVRKFIPESLEVQALKRDGSPFAGKLVQFKVIRSDARLSTDKETSRADGLVTLQARTDEQGLAQVYLRLGSDAGCGNNQVEVTSAGLTGSIVFCASAKAGPASQINVGSGNSQKGAVGSPAVLPLRAWVNDACNGIEGVSVTFAVIQGNGKVDGSSFTTVTTSRTGHAEVPFIYGDIPGNNVIIADFPNNNFAPAQFVNVGVNKSEESKTTFSGVVLNNSRSPVEGALALLTIGGIEHAALTDAKGYFKIGDLQLLDSGPAALIVDGREASCDDCTYPELHYDEIIIVDQGENSLPTPILLPKLDPRNEVLYDGTQDVELTVAGIEGLKMTVKAGSMTRVDGTKPTPERPEVLKLNQVHHDDIPMPMPDGAAPPFAWTLQPGGATFDPPVAIEYPNMSGLPPGQIGYFLTFDHDTGSFEIVGTGRVIEDGSLMVSDPGSGLTLSGWGCNCPPYAVTGDCCSGGVGGGGGAQNADQCCTPSCLTSPSFDESLAVLEVDKPIICTGESFSFCVNDVLLTSGTKIDSNCNETDVNGDVTYQWKVSLPSGGFEQLTSSPSLSVNALEPGAYNCEVSILINSECGISGPTLIGTASATAVDVVTETVSNFPPDRKNRRTVGVCERVQIQTNPRMVFEWEVEGNGSITRGLTSNATFTAGDTAGKNTIQIKNLDVVICEIEFKVIKPSGVSFDLEGFIHTRGRASCGMCFSIRLLPTTVSFGNLQIREGETEAITSGYMTDWCSRRPSCSLCDLSRCQWKSIREDNFVGDFLGALTLDTSQFSGNPPYSDGEFLYRIPLLYRCSGSDDFYEFTQVEDLITIDENGQVTVSKGGISNICQVDDPNEECR